MSRPAPTIPALDLKPQLEALRPEIDAAIARVLNSGVFVLGPEVEAFEETARYPSVEHATGFKMIGDAAQVFGAGVGDKKVESIGDVGTFSFYPTKNLDALGDERRSTMNDNEAVRLAPALRNHSSFKRYDSEMLGYPSRLDRHLNSDFSSQDVLY